MSAKATAPGTVARTVAGATAKRRFRPGGLAATVVIVLLIACVAVSSLRFYRYLEKQLFEERKTHLIEITQKVAEVVDTVIDSVWSRVKTCTQLLRTQTLSDEGALLDGLAAATAFIDAQDCIIMAFDQNANFYTSDGHTGYWSDATALLPTRGENQEMLSSIPYQSADATYMIFLSRMPQAQILQDTGKQITHVALAVALESLRDVFTVPGFQDQCYTYIINQEGRRLYRNTFSQNFIDSYNILSALSSRRFIQGGDIDTLRASIASGGSVALEFDYDGASFFVASTSIRAEDWQVMLFVPTQVLGANSSALMNRTIQFFLAMAALAVALFSAMVYMVMASRSDKRLLRQQQQTNRLLETAAQEAQSANAAKSQFLSHMSHDIRTPINGIMGMTNIAMQCLDDPGRVRDCLEKVEVSSRHLLSLVNDVLDMSRIESGKVEIAHEPMDMNAVANHCASITASQLTGRNVEFIREFGDFDRPAVLGDELHLRQVLLNILGNAVKFVPDGGKIIFRVRQVAEGQGRAAFRFQVEDTGIGMSPEFLPRIWDAFSQEDGEGRTNYQGTGLGLAITKQFVDLMGGSISAESQRGVGSRFTVDIPFDVDTASPRAAAAPQAESRGSLAGMRVLLVEDNELNMEIARYMLENWGVEVTGAENGRIAVDAFAAHPPGYFDAILMDVTMPVMDGLTATRTIRGLNRPDGAAVPIIAMTANAYREDVQRALAAGMNLHLSKPMDVDALFNALVQYKK